MREIETHKVNPCNDVLKIEVADAPGSGGANHRYLISGFSEKANPSSRNYQLPQVDSRSSVEILFQNGPIAEAGVNGLTQEVLLAIVEDRLQAFQNGPFATEENSRALAAVKEAQHWLQFRTLKRMARGVEGTHAK